MADCLFFLYWPDFAPLGPPVTRSLAAHAIRRHLCAQYEDLVAFAWDPEPGGQSEFSRWGMRILPEALPPDGLLSMVRRHPDPAALVLAMRPDRAAGIAPLVEPLGIQVEIWSPAGSNGSSSSLREVLRLDTRHRVGLFVDEPATGLSGAGERESFRNRLLELAGSSGSLLAAVWGGEDEPLQDLAGAAPLVADESTLEEHLRARLRHGDELETWTLVSDAPWVEEIVALAHRAGKRVLLWPPNTERLSRAVTLAADVVCPLAVVLDRELPARPVPSPRPIQAEVKIAAQTWTRGSDRPAEAAEEVRPLPTAGENARLNAWLRLLYYVECAQRDAGGAWVPARKLVAALAEVEEFGPSAANATLWLNRARAEGLLQSEQEASRLNPALRQTVYRLTPEHPLCRIAVDVPDRCLRLLFQMLQKIPWVSFKLLRGVLLREQWLGGPPYRMDEVAIDEWLNFLIHSGAIRMTKEPNLVNPDYPVTALRLNEEHPLSRAIATEASETTRLAAERAILAVDHFLTRNRKPWMAMGALRRALDGMSREELQSVLQGLQNLGALITESYPNPQKEHFTTGCRLKLDEPMVERALTVRNRIIQAARRHGRDRAWVPLTRVFRTLEEEADGASTPQRLAWFMLLRDEGILELDQEGALVSHGWETVRCRLNVLDAVVRSVIAEIGEGYGAYEGE